MKEITLAIWGALLALIFVIIGGWLIAREEFYDEKLVHIKCLETFLDKDKCNQIFEERN